MRRGALGLVAFAVAVLGGVVVAGACDDEPRSHIFIGRQYVATQGCVTPSAGIDVVTDPAPSGPACSPVCIIDLAGDVFVSGMCPPYPYPDTIEAPDGGPDGSPIVALDPTCAAALQVYDCNVTCGDAGFDSGLPPMDAGTCVIGTVDGGHGHAIPDAGDAALGTGDGASSDGAALD